MKRGRLRRSHIEFALPRSGAVRGFRLPARPSARPRFAPHSGNLLDPGVEALVAQWLVLVQRQPDVVDHRPIQLSAEQRPIGAAALLVAVTEGTVQGVRCKQGVGQPQAAPGRGRSIENSREMRVRAVGVKPYL